MFFPGLSRMGGAVSGAVVATPHRFWRLTNISVSSTDWMINELQLWTDTNNRADVAGTTLATSFSVAFGTLPQLLDGIVNAFVEFFPTSTSGTVTWDFGVGTPKAVTGFKHADRAGGAASNALTTASLQWSDDNSVWNAAGNAVAIAFSGDTLSAFIPFI